MRTRRIRSLALVAVLSIVATACGPGVASQSPSGPAATGGSTPAATDGGTSAAPGGSFEAADLRWYCCLGTGEDPAQIPTEEEVAAAFGTKHAGSSLKFEVVTYDQARDALATQIAAGNGPDVVGPVGVGGLAAFDGQWLDLAPYIEKTGYDTSQYDAAAVDFYNTDDGQIGLPFAVYPSMLWYKADLFEEAGLELPPHEYGAKYTMPDGSEVDWSYETVAELAKILTVDENGNDATSPDFDPDAIVQYGFEPQRDDLRGLGAYWGAGSLAGGSDGTTVEIPDAWTDAWKYFYNGMWTDHTIMTGAVAESEEFSGGGYPFFSGRVAMSLNFLWTTYGVADAGDDWDLAAIPSHNGTVTSPLNADTFAIHKDTKNPDAAFAALTYLLDDASDQLLNLYGGMPARPDKQDAFFETLGQSEGFPEEVDWQVAKDSIEFADNPNFEAPMPKYNETLTILEKYETKWTTTPGLDLDAEIEALRAEIQAAWDA
jgi:multiple sugar transport system substrate-binding protein